MPATCPSLAQARKLTARCKNPKVPWSLFNGGRARAEALYGRCAPLAKRAAEGLIVDADGDPIRRISVPSKTPKSAVTVGSGAAPAVPTVPSNLKPGAAPKPGVKPVRPTSKPAGSGGARPSGKGARPSGKRSR